MYRPLMEEPPQPITAESLRCGVDRGEVIIDTKTWESWLPPAVLEHVSFGTQITKLIERFPYPLPPPGHYEQMEEPDGNKLTPEKIKIWNKILFQAQNGGKDFDEIVKATRKALAITAMGSK